MTASVNPYFMTPALSKSLILISGWLVELLLAFSVTNSRYRRASSFTLSAPDVKRASSGTGMNRLSFGIWSTGVLRRASWESESLNSLNLFSSGSLTSFFNSNAIGVASSLSSSFCSSLLSSASLADSAVISSGMTSTA